MRCHALFICLIALATGCSSISEDRASIAEVLHQSFDRPGTSADIDPIVIRQSYAVAGVVMGAGGGRVLLHREKGKWKVVGQAGEEMRNAQFLKQAGLSQAEASALANVLIATERRLPEARLALLDKNAEVAARR